MKKILLLGANGQLGTDIQKILAGPEYQLLAIFRTNLNVENTQSIGSFLEPYSDYDMIINCTSYHKTDECENNAEKAFRINSLAVFELSKFCLKTNTVLLHISTDYVFDGCHETPYTETDIPRPLNVYGISKVSGEHFIQAYLDRYFILRVSSLFGQAGASGKGGNFVETMIRLAKEKKDIRVVDDQIMSPTHTLDIAKSIQSIIDQNVDNYGIYHCSGEGQCSWYQFAKEIFEQTGIESNLSPVHSNEYVTNARRPSFSVLDNSKLSYYHKMPDWQDSLNEYLKLKGYLI